MEDSSGNAGSVKCTVGLYECVLLLISDLYFLVMSLHSESWACVPEYSHLACSRAKPTSEQGVIIRTNSVAIELGPLKVTMIQEVSGAASDTSVCTVHMYHMCGSIVSCWLL